MMVWVIHDRANSVRLYLSRCRSGDYDLGGRFGPTRRSHTRCRSILLRPTEIKQTSCPQVAWKYSLKEYLKYALQIQIRGPPRSLEKPLNFKYLRETGQPEDLPQIGSRFTGSASPHILLAVEVIVW